MFNAREAFSDLDGKTYDSWSDLRAALVNMRLEHLSDLPPGTGPEALYDIAIRNGWVRSVGAKISITLDKEK